MLKKYWLLIWIGAATLAACNNEEMGSSKNVGDDAIFADYKIWGEEGKEAVTVLVQFRRGGPDGATLTLQSPGSVSIDSIPLAVDSAGKSGAYYEAAFPLATFSGNHFIEYTSAGGKTHRQPFRFAAFTFGQEPPDTIGMKPVTLLLAGLPQKRTTLRVVMTDTAFASNDVHTEVVVENGALNITAQMWQALQPGPVVLEIYADEEKKLVNFTKEGGVITISYALKRTFTAVPQGAHTLIKK